MAMMLYNVIMDASNAEENIKKTTREKAEAAAAKAATAETPAPVASPATTAKTDTTKPAAKPAQVGPAKPATSAPPSQPAGKKTDDTPYDPAMIRYVLWAISLAGGLGAALSNLRGVFEFSRDHTYFPAYLELPFYMRPFSGIICGMFTFFVSTFFAGALTQGDNSGWHTLQGMFPYIGLAFIAGYASQEFMERLKETAKSLFGVPTTAAQPPAAPAAPAAKLPVSGLDDDGHESFNPNAEIAPPPPETGRSIAPPVVQPTPPPVTGRRPD
jgi:hypothetical protein